MPTDETPAKHPESFDCFGCESEVFRDDEGRLSDYCKACLERRWQQRPAKLGLVVVAPDDTILGAFVKRDGGDWRYRDA